MPQQPIETVGIEVPTQHPARRAGPADQPFALEELEYFVPFILWEKPATAVHVAQAHPTSQLLALMKNPRQHQHNRQAERRLAHPPLRGRLPTDQLGTE